MKRLQNPAPWFFALLGIGVTLWLFYPGYLSWDSANQWWQARHADYNTVSPPLMSMIWRLTDKIWPGPGGMFALQITLIWTALAAFAATLDRPIWQKCLLVLLAGFWPPLFGLSLHIWKDLWTMQAFAWTVVFLLRDLQTPSRTWRIFALLAITAACAFRHNALSGALPFLVWIVHRESIDRKIFAGWWRNSIATLLLAILVLGAAKLPELDPRVKETDRIWSVVTLWDASAVSLIEGRLIIPAELKENSLTLQDLRNHIHDYTNTTVFESGKLKHSFGGPYTDAQRSALTHLMLSLPTEHANAYFRHRWRLSELLFGLDQKGLPDGQVFMPGIQAYNDNPAVAANTSGYEHAVLTRLQALIDTPFFAGWIYLLIALLLCFGFLLRPNSPAAKLAGVIALSCLGYALPFSLVSGSAEFRYLAWPVLACLMSLALMWSALRSKPDPVTTI